MKAFKCKEQQGCFLSRHCFHLEAVAQCNIKARLLNSAQHYLFPQRISASVACWLICDKIGTAFLIASIKKTKPNPQLTQYSRNARRPCLFLHLLWTVTNGPANVDKLERKRPFIATICHSTLGTVVASFEQIFVQLFCHFRFSLQSEVEVNRQRATLSR